MAATSPRPFPLPQVAYPQELYISTITPDALRADLAFYTGCMAGAARIDDLEAMLTAAGFTQVRIKPKVESHAFIADWAPGRPVTDYVVSADIEGVKPG